jgi:hypothetical protein
MANPVEFPFAKARKITPEEVMAAEKAIKEQFGIDASRGMKLYLNRTYA